MEEGPISESGYYFPASDIKQYLDKLSNTNEYYEDVPIGLGEDVVVMTHDDIFDPVMYEYEISHDHSSTWLIDTSMKSDKIPCDADVHLHFNKEIKLTLNQQIIKFKEIYGKYPKFNRNHRLLWKSNNFDYPLLAMNGIRVDTTLIGTQPFVPVINGKVIPIVELPFCISDTPTRPMATYNVAKDIETPFKHRQSIITVLAHPFPICDQYQLKSCFYEVISMAKKYNYRVVSISDFYNSIVCDLIDIIK